MGPVLTDTEVSSFQSNQGGSVLAGREVLLVGADVEKVNVNGGAIATSLERV
jgi:acetyl-CoA acetyltransferase